MDCISNGKITVIGTILEHLEPAGIHSGDSAGVTPPMTLTNNIIGRIRTHVYDLTGSLNVCGLMNIQFVPYTPAKCISLK